MVLSGSVFVRVASIHSLLRTSVPVSVGVVKLAELEGDSQAGINVSASLTVGFTV